MTGKNQPAFKEPYEDPAHKPWVWLIFLILLALMPPVWPVSGEIFGLPTWVIGTVLISFVTSVFISFVIFKIWRDCDKPSPSRKKSKV